MSIKVQIHREDLSEANSNLPPFHRGSDSGFKGLWFGWGFTLARLSSTSQDTHPFECSSQQAELPMGPHPLSGGRTFLKSQETIGL